MIFYKRFIGEVGNMTGELSCAEQGVFDRLLDHYIAKEEQLPGSLERCCRIARAMSEAERQAVDVVLGQFYVLQDGAYRFPWADALLAEAAPRIAAAQANGKLGGRPRKQPAETQTKPSGLSPGNPVGTQSGTQTEPNAKASQSQSQSQKEQEKDPPAARVPPAGAGHRAAKKCPESFEVTDELRQWAATETPLVDIDAETKMLRDHTFSVARSDWPGTWRNWMRKEEKELRKRARHTNGHANGHAAEQPAWARRKDAEALNAAMLVGAIPRPPGPRATLTPPTENDDASSSRSFELARLRPPGAS